MTDAKKYLQQIQLLDVKINNKQEEKQRLRERLYNITPTLKPDTGTGSRASDKLGNTVPKIADIDAEIEMYAARKKDIMSVLDKLESPDQLKVLHARFVQFKSVKQIAADLGKSQRRIYEIQKKGLQAVNKILKTAVNRSKPQ